MREILVELVRRIGYDIHKQQETAESEKKLISETLLAIKKAYEGHMKLCKKWSIQ